MDFCWETPMFSQALRHSFFHWKMSFFPPFTAWEHPGPTTVTAAPCPLAPPPAAVQQVVVTGDFWDSFWVDVQLKVWNHINFSWFFVVGKVSHERFRQYIPGWQPWYPSCGGCSMFFFGEEINSQPTTWAKQWDRTMCHTQERAMECTGLIYHLVDVWYIYGGEFYNKTWKALGALFFLLISWNQDLCSPEAFELLLPGVTSHKCTDELSEWRIWMNMA